MHKECRDTRIGVRMKVYVLTMARWGDTENHSYVWGVYSSLSEAYLEGIRHESFRCGKYEPIIEEFNVDSLSTSHKISLYTAQKYAIMEFPHLFDDKGNLKE